MNFNKFINSDYLKSNPLCGIGTYKDELNLVTGDCTRQIKKLVLTGEEGWVRTANQRCYYINASTGCPTDYLKQRIITSICSHYQSQNNTSGSNEVKAGHFCFYTGSVFELYIGETTISSAADFKSYLQQQYANGTPVTIWYVLAESTTETITVPSGLSGTEEGYLNQSGTPTPMNPIYPTANTVEKWFDINHYIMGTSTDTITTPAVLYPNDTTATVGLKGQMEQNGAPTPQNPIMPQGTGERTGNLLDSDTVYSAYKQSDGTYLGTVNNFYTTHVKPFTSGDIGKTFTFTMVVKATTSTNVRASANINGTAINGNNLSAAGTTTVTFTVSSVNDYLYLGYGGGGANPITLDNIMLNTGSTALPYEPYGYKIPISSANTTTPVHLGEVETTRKIKKIVFDGTESWTITSGKFYYTTLPSYPINWLAAITSHFEVREDISTTGCARFGGTATIPQNTFIFNYDDGTGGITAWKSYLAAQYAAGTPVTVWYVLATPTTGIVNEPLRKIGDYADEVSGITIPTTAGANTLSVDTTLQPSEVSVNYKGWHPVQSVHKKSYNLCPSTGWKSGQYRDGVWEETNTRSTSDMFPVTSSQYRLKINAGQLISFINFNYFDSQKQWLGNRTTLGMSTFSPTEQNIVIPQLPSNVAYMSITIRFYNDNGNPPIPQSYIDNSNVMVTEGTSEPAYEPYWK